VAVGRNGLASEGSVFYACGGRTRCWSRRAFGPQLSRAPVRGRTEMEYDEFIARYRAGTVRLGVDRSRIGKAARSELYQHLFKERNYPQMLNRLATVFSLLIIPSLLAAVIFPFIIVWWAFIPCLAVAWFFKRMTYRCEREAFRELALADPMAYKFLLLEGIIIVDAPFDSSIGGSDQSRQK